MTRLLHIDPDEFLVDSFRLGREVYLRGVRPRHAISIWRGDSIDEGHDWETSDVGNRRPPEEAPGSGGPSPAVEKKLADLMAEAATLEADGKLQEALDKVLEVIKISPAHPGALAKAAELRAKLSR